MVCRVSRISRDREEENAGECQPDAEPLVSFQALVIDDNAEGGGEDDIAFTNGHYDGNLDECCCRSIKKPCCIVADALDEDGDAVQAEFLIKIPPLSLGGKVDYTEGR